MPRSRSLASAIYDLAGPSADRPLHGGLNLEGGWQRLAGYRRAMADAGLPVEDALVLVGAYMAASGAECMREMLDRPGVRPTAVFCANDAMAHGALEVMASCGLRAPKDLSLGGFDDLMLARMTSPQLVVRQSVGPAPR